MEADARTVAVVRSACVACQREPSRVQTESQNFEGVRAETNAAEEAARPANAAPQAHAALQADTAGNAASRRQLVEELLSRRAGGDASAHVALWHEIYDEVHRLAHSMLVKEGSRRPIDTTVLVHELFLKMGDSVFENPAHLFGSLVRMMGQIITDAARRAIRERRAQEFLQARGAADGLALDTQAIGLPRDETGSMSAGIVAVLERLDALAPRAAAVAWLRFVGGLTVEQTAVCLGISERTVKSDWAFARAWMHRELSAPSAGSAGTDGSSRSQAAESHDDGSDERRNRP
jgi:RNA polymerase sigma factor (TIGR02999 family)